MLSWEPIFIAAGAITGLRRRAGACCWAASRRGWSSCPILQHRGVIEGSGYAALVQWTLWGGVACMVTSSLLSFAHAVAHARARLRRSRRDVRRRRGRAADDPVAAIETPPSWFIGGQLVALVGLAWLGHVTFGMPYWQTAVAVLLSFVLALVACRVTGETDTTPVGAMGKITQLTFGVLSPGNMNVNLMSANITAGGGGQQRRSADRPEERLPARRQSAQTVHRAVRRHLRRHARHACSRSGCSCPTRACWARTSSRRPPRRPGAPWRSRSRTASGRSGRSRSGPSSSAALVGIVLSVLPAMFPARRHLIPSPAGVGLAWTFHWYYGLLFFVGGAARLVGGEEAPALVGGVHLSGRVRLDRRREPHGRGARDLGERPGPRAPAPRPLNRGAC